MQPTLMKRGVHQRVMGLVMLLAEENEGNSLSGAREISVGESPATARHSAAACPLNKI